MPLRAACHMTRLERRPRRLPRCPTVAMQITGTVCTELCGRWMFECCGGVGGKARRRRRSNGVGSVTLGQRPDRISTSPFAAPPCTLQALLCSLLCAPELDPVQPGGRRPHCRRCTGAGSDKHVVRSARAPRTFRPRSRRSRALAALPAVGCLACQLQTGAKAVREAFGAPLITCMRHRGVASEGDAPGGLIARQPTWPRTPQGAAAEGHVPGRVGLSDMASAVGSVDRPSTTLVRPARSASGYRRHASVQRSTPPTLI